MREGVDQRPPHLRFVLSDALARFGGIHVAILDCVC